MKPKPKTKPKKPNRHHGRIYGRIYPPHTLFLRVHVGTAKDGRRHYEMSTNGGGSVPIIHSKQTGKWFCLPWDDIIDLAIVAGIDEE